MKWGPEDVSLLERCPYFSVHTLCTYIVYIHCVQASIELESILVSLLESKPLTRQPLMTSH